MEGLLLRALRPFAKHPPPASLVCGSFKTLFLYMLNLLTHGPGGSASRIVQHLRISSASGSDTLCTRPAPSAS